MHWHNLSVSKRLHLVTYNFQPFSIPISLEITCSLFYFIAFTAWLYFTKTIKNADIFIRSMVLWKALFLDSQMNVNACEKTLIFKHSSYYIYMYICTHMWRLIDYWFLKRKQIWHLSHNSRLHNWSLFCATLENIAIDFFGLHYISQGHIRKYIPSLTSLEYVIGKLQCLEWFLSLQ